MKNEQEKNVATKKTTSKKNKDLGNQNPQGLNEQNNQVKKEQPTYDGKPIYPNIP